MRAFQIVQITYCVQSLQGDVSCHKQHLYPSLPCTTKPQSGNCHKHEPGLTFCMFTYCQVSIHQNLSSHFIHSCLPYPPQTETNKCMQCLWIVLINMQIRFRLYKQHRPMFHPCAHRYSSGTALPH